MSRYVVVVADFEAPTDLQFNRGLVLDPAALASEGAAASWRFLCGEEFAAIEGGMSYASVQAAATASANIVSDPPRVLDIELARDHVAALDSRPRPTLVTGRTGPRSSALARAEADGAPFTGSEDLKEWVAQGLVEVS
jgi:hypothetical protein